MQVLVLPVSGELYGVPLEAVMQVVTAPRVTRVPTAPDALLGLINVAGEIVPLFDTGALIGTPGADLKFAVVAATSLGPAALATDGTPRSEELGEPVAPGERTGEVAIYVSEGSLLVLLNVEELLGSRAGLTRAS